MAGSTGPSPSIVESIPGRSPNVVAGSPSFGSSAVVNGGSQSIPSASSSAGPFNNSQSSGVPIEERIIGGSDVNIDPSVAPNNAGVVTNNPSFQDSQIPSSSTINRGNTGVVTIPSTPSTGTFPSAPSTNVATAPIQAKFSEEDYYQQGFELLKEAEHDRAVQVFQEQIASYPQGELVDDAYYWIAESKYVNRDLAGSKQNFKTIIERYKQSPRLPDAMLKTAYIEQEQGNAIEARILLQEIVQFYPRSNAAISAKNRLDDL